MNKRTRVNPTDDTVDPVDLPADRAMDAVALFDVLEAMEPGLLVWDDDEKCAFYTDRLKDVLGMRASDIAIGMSREDFLHNSLQRGEISTEQLDSIKRQFSRGETFQFDRQIRSGRVVSTRARPFGIRGYVITFTDVTRERSKSQELDETIRNAYEARMQLASTLELEKNRQYEGGLLNEFSDWLQSCKTLDELYQIVERFLAEKMPGSQGELYIYSNSRDVLDGVLSWGRIKLQGHIHADSCWGLRRGRSYRFSKEEICFECAHVSAITHLPIDEYSCIPIVAHGDTVGLLHVRFGACAMSETQLTSPSRFASKCGELISMAIANVRLRDELHEQSTRDMLTGLRNRRYCIDAMAAQKSAALRQDKPFSVISLDVDRFKSFNDNFGHDAGDVVLQHISTTMSEVMDQGQIPCRFGGEEFLIILPDLDQEAAAAVADDLRNKVMKTQLSYAGKPLPSVTISLGVATFPASSDTVEGLLREADVALYQAKENGRNRVELAAASTGKAATKSAVKDKKPAKK